MSGPRQARTPRTALLHLAAELEARGVARVSVKRRRGDRYGSLVLERDDRRPRRVVFPPHNTRVNLELLAEVARMPREIGGGGMGRADVQRLTGGVQ